MLHAICTSPDEVDRICGFFSFIAARPQCQSKTLALHSNSFWQHRRRKLRHQKAGLQIMEQTRKPREKKPWEMSEFRMNSKKVGSEVGSSTTRYSSLIQHRIEGFDSFWSMLEVQSLGELQTQLPRSCWRQLWIAVEIEKNLDVLDQSRWESSVWLFLNFLFALCKQACEGWFLHRTFVSQRARLRDCKGWWVTWQVSEEIDVNITLVQVRISAPLMIFDAMEVSRSDFSSPFWHDRYWGVPLHHARSSLSFAG